MRAGALHPISDGPMEKSGWHEHQKSLAHAVE